MNLYLFERMKELGKGFPSFFLACPLFVYAILLLKVMFAPSLFVQLGQLAKRKETESRQAAAQDYEKLFRARCLVCFALAYWPNRSPNQEKPRTSTIFR